MLAAGAMLAVGRFVPAAEPAKVRRVVMVLPWVAGSSPEVAAGIERYLASFGHRRGRNLELVELHWAKWTDERRREFAGHSPDVAFVWGPGAARQALDASPRTPVVIADSGAALESGLVRSYNAPGGRVTGYHFPDDELAKRQLSLMRAFRPRIEGVALVNYGPPDSDLPKQRAVFESAGCRVRVVTDPVEAFEALAGYRRQGIDTAIYYDNPANPFPTEGRMSTADSTRTHAREAIRAGVLTLANYDHAVQNGLLAGWLEDEEDFLRSIAFLIDRLLRGADPATVPFMVPSRFKLWVNARTAKAMGLAIPPSIRVAADRVFE